jgi:hypothetical protein
MQLNNVDKSHLIALINENKLIEAEEFALSISKREENNPEFNYIFFHLLNRQYRYKESLSYIRLASELLPIPDFNYHFADTLYRVGKLDEARDVVDRLLAQSELDPRLIELRGKIKGRAESLVGCRLELVDLISTESNIEHKSQGTAYKPVYSARNEQRLVETYCNNYSKSQQPYLNVLVDIGAGDGMTFSNSLALLQSGFWKGVMIEGNSYSVETLARLAKSTKIDIDIAKCYVTPDRVNPLLKAFGVPKRFGFLTLDVDSIEYPLLNAILTEFRPGLICVEINERIPPSVEYFKTYVPTELIPHAPLYMGASLKAFFNLFALHGYIGFHLEYNNLFAAPSEDKSIIEQLGYKTDLTAYDLFRTGFQDRGDAYSLFPWNESFKPLFPLSKSEFSENWSQKLADNGFTFHYVLR